KAAATQQSWVGRGGESTFTTDGDYKNLNNTAVATNYIIDASGWYYGGYEEDFSDFDFSGNKYYKFLTPDGIAHAFADGWIFVDVNARKGPNQMGRDLFVFHFLRGDPNDATVQRGVLPVGSGISTASSNCNVNGIGWHCALRVLTEGAMNY
ncbi:hypothetical protein tpqmel_0953, partial [Candidatus Gastranaerophilus sp. (ex Termes propinquus)]